jgi:hypothetical protein
MHSRISIARTFLLCGLAAGAFAATPALAQDVPQDAVAEEEYGNAIIVTARRR